MKLRRSLSHVGGSVHASGDPGAAAILTEALRVAPSPTPKANARTSHDGADDADRAHVHGFHSYPARMHPATAAHLVRSISVEGSAVLDPFCGSGTVLVEAALAGRRAVGTDLNPLAVRLARVKTSRFDEGARQSLVAEARAIAAFADGRRQARAGATHRYSPEDVALFAPHVLLELDSIAAGIRERAEGDDRIRAALELLLSAILVKVSRKSSDTSAAVEPRRVAAGYPARLFARKAEELSRRLEEFDRLLPAGAVEPSVEIDDAARLRTVAASSVDAIVTSPPYAATYDYLSHHALRMRWLGLDSRGLEANEIGARRNYARLDVSTAAAAWKRELGRALRSMGRVCRPGARIVLLVGDSAVDRHALRADETVTAVAGDAGLDVVAVVSQARPHFHGPTTAAFRVDSRREHAIALEKP